MASNTAAATGGPVASNTAAAAAGVASNTAAAAGGVASTLLREDTPMEAPIAKLGEKQPVGTEVLTAKAVAKNFMIGNVT